MSLTYQELIDTIESNPSGVREALELVKRQLAAYPSATSADDGDTLALSKDDGSGTTQALSVATLLLRAVENNGGAVSFESGSLANRPTTGIDGAWYFATDEGVLYRDDGASWNAILGNTSLVEQATDTGTDVYASGVNTTPPDAGYTVRRDFQSANTTTTPTLDSLTITTRDGSALWAGALSGVHELQLNAGGGSWLVLDPVPDDSAGQQDLLSEDGAYVWFGNPRAVRHVGGSDRTYAGWVASDGDIQIGSYTHADGSREVFSLNTTINEYDDHNAPSICVLADGTILAFYTDHSGGPIRMRRSTNPEDVTAFDTEITIGTGGMMYPTPYRLSGESRIYLFYNESNRHMVYRYSDDDGSTWSGEQALIQHDGTSGYRLYFVSNSDEQGRVDFAITLAQGAKDEPKRDVRHCYFSAETLYGADGTELGTASGGAFPLAYTDIPAVYDSDAQGSNVWVWDVEIGTVAGQPQIVYAEFPEKYRHYYRYAAWTGSAWKDRRFADAGRYIVLGNQRELYYSGGVTLSKTDGGVVYASIGHEHYSKLQKWITADDGESFQVYDYADTGGQNVRPYAPVGAHEDAPVIWCQGRYPHYSEFDMAVVFGRGRADSSQVPTLIGGGSALSLSSTISFTGGSGLFEIPFDQTKYDSRGGEFNSSEGSIVVAFSGFYMVSAGLFVEGMTSGGTFQGKVIQNGNNLVALNRVTGDTNAIINGSSVVYLKRGDVLKLGAEYDVSESVNVRAAPAYTYLSAFQIH